MEQDKMLLDELVGKKVVIKTHWGTGTKDDMLLGDYKGILLGHDDKFMKVEYEIKKFVEGTNIISKSTLLINTSQIITIEEYEEKV
jgi:hypothetical protein